MSIRAACSGAGDVKYHVGATGTYVTSTGKEMHSTGLESEYLEASILWPWDGRALSKHATALEALAKVVAHRDARRRRLRGQGVGQRRSTWQICRPTPLRNNSLIVNNLIGFTTRPEQEQSSRSPRILRSAHYGSGVSRHGEDPDAPSLRVGQVGRRLRAQLAATWWSTSSATGATVIAEVDDPLITQPRVYERIKNHAPLWRLYSERIGVQPMQIVENVRKEYEEEQTKRARIQKDSVSFGSCLNTVGLPPRRFKPE